MRLVAFPARLACCPQQSFVVPPLRRLGLPLAERCDVRRGARAPRRLGRPRNAPREIGVPNPELLAAPVRTEPPLVGRERRVSRFRRA